MFSFLVLILVPLYAVNAYKILIVCPIPGKSHAILGNAMVEHLSKAGHEITYITVFGPEKLPPNVTVVDISDNVKHFPSVENLGIKAFMEKTGVPNFLYGFVPMMIHMSTVAVNHPNVQKLISDKNQHFDVIIAEWMFTEIYAGFSAVYKCPLIWLSPMRPNWMILQLIDEIPNSAYTVDVFSYNIVPLTFKQRVEELYLQTIGKLIHAFWISENQNILYDKYFAPAVRDRYSSVPSFDTLKFNASLILSNSHFSMGSPTRLPPNFISIGGYHIETNVKPLPEPYVYKITMNAASTATNAFTAHTNCILFITHGGLLSTTESIHFGVPTIGIPVFADQFVNVASSVEKGYAVKVDLSYGLAADLEIAIEEILKEPKYAAKTKLLSMIYHDRPVPPGKELVHWVEHVVKTQGAIHLRSPAFMVPWYQKMYLDLILMLLVLLVALKCGFKFVKNTILLKKKEKIN